MAVKIPDEDYGRMMWGLREIAWGYRINDAGDPQRISRDDLRLIAARICDHFGWTHGRADFDARSAGKE